MWTGRGRFGAGAIGTVLVGAADYVSRGELFAQFGVTVKPNSPAAAIAAVIDSIPPLFYATLALALLLIWVFYDPLAVYLPKLIEAAGDEISEFLNKRREFQDQVYQVARVMGRMDPSDLNDDKAYLRSLNTFTTKWFTYYYAVKQNLKTIIGLSDPTMKSLWLASTLPGKYKHVSDLLLQLAPRVPEGTPAIRRPRRQAKPGEPYDGRNSA
jgi:hypothetical protein